MSPHKKSLLGLTDDPWSLHRGLFHPRPPVRTQQSRSQEEHQQMRGQLTESPSCELAQGLWPHNYQLVLIQFRSLPTGQFAGSQAVQQDRKGAKVSQGHGLQVPPGLCVPGPVVLGTGPLPRGLAAFPSDSRARGRGRVG